MIVSLSKNGWTDRDAVLDVDSGELKEAFIRWGLLDGVAHWRNPAKTIEPSMYDGDAAFYIALH